jgi:hypothetical protein
MAERITAISVWEEIVSALDAKHGGGVDKWGKLADDFIKRYEQQIHRSVLNCFYDARGSRFGDSVPEDHIIAACYEISSMTGNAEIGLHTMKILQNFLARKIEEVKTTLAEIRKDI